jgi:sodium/proline symporter
MYELLPAFLLSCLAIYLVSKATPEPEQAVLDTFDHYMDSTGARRNLEEVLEENLASDLPEYAATTYPHGKKK